MEASYVANRGSWWVPTGTLRSLNALSLSDLGNRGFTNLTSKAESDLFSPLAGTLVTFNDVLLKDPSAINVDAYGAGWLFDLIGEANGTMTAAEYHQFLEAGWANTQRIIKGQMGD